MVVRLVVGTWLVRALFLGLPEPLSIDEVSALAASEHGTASRFVASRDPAEWWDIANHFRQWHALWTAPHSVFGYLFASGGQMAYVLTQLCALLAMLTLAALARRLFGERAGLLALLLAALSPLFLNYTVRALGTMPATMWLCLALVLLTSPRWSVLRWFGAGLCFALAFGASFGAGAPVIAITLGLAVSIASRALDGSRPVSRRVRDCVIGPVAGAVAAVLPILLVDMAATSAGSVFLGFLFQHTMLVTTEWPGPWGLWLREMLELDPMLQVLAIVALVGALRGTAARGTIHRWAVAGTCVAGGGLLALSLDQAAPRAIVSLLVFAVIGLGVSVGLTPGTEDGPTAAADVSPAVAGPFDRRALIVSVCALIAILTIWRDVSNMARLVFPSWPLLVLGSIGLMLWAMPRQRLPLGRIAVVGSVVFLLGAGATLHAKTAHARALADRAQHPYLTQVSYQDLWTPETMTATFAHMSRRARHEVKVFGSPATLYPSSVYEEDPSKIVMFRETLTAFGLDDVLTAERLIYATLAFEAAAGESAPPPGTPERPHVVQGRDQAGRLFAPSFHPYRGIALRFPPAVSTGPLAIEVTMRLPATPSREGILGMEVLAMTPNLPPDARLTMEAFQGERRLEGGGQVRIEGSRGQQGDASVPLHEVPRQGREPFRLVRWAIVPVAAAEDVRIVARLDLPVGRQGPSVACYIRRPYIQPR